MSPSIPTMKRTRWKGDLLVDTEVNGIRVKSVLQIYREAAAPESSPNGPKWPGSRNRTLSSWPRSSPATAKRRWPTSTAACPSTRPGFYNVLAWMTVNVLIGNHDWMGGLSKATTYDIIGDREGKPFDANEAGGEAQELGVSIIRHERLRQDHHFQRLPGKAGLVPFQQRHLPGSDPQHRGCLPLSHQGPAPLHGIPGLFAAGGHKLVEILTDPRRSRSSSFRISSSGKPACTPTTSSRTSPTWSAGNLPDRTPRSPRRSPPFGSRQRRRSRKRSTVYGEKMPLSLESLVLGCRKAEAAGIRGKRLRSGSAPQAGRGHVPADGGQHRLWRQAGRLGEGSGGKRRGNQNLRTGAPASATDHLRCQPLEKRGRPENWPHVVYVLNRGGRFQGYAQAYKDGQLANKYGKMVGIYMEKFATTKHSMTGKTLPAPRRLHRGPVDCTGNPDQR